MFIVLIIIKIMEKCMLCWFLNLERCATMTGLLEVVSGGCSLIKIGGLLQKSSKNSASKNKITSMEKLIDESESGILWNRLYRKESLSDCL